jgi:LacI family transcriptional regulator
VSLVLNDVPDIHITEETKERVRQVARNLNYYPDAVARRLAKGKSGTLALVWHRGPDEHYRDSFLPGFLQGISRGAQHFGYHLLFRPMEPDEPSRDYVELARGHHTDGLILSGPRYDDVELIQLHEDGFPLVLHGEFPGTPIPSVDVDNVSGARMAAEHLLSLGHRRLGMITNAPLAYTASQQRLEGYRRALEAAGLPFEEELVAVGDFDEESGYRGMTQLLSLSQPPSAVFIASDTVALGALRAVRDRGLRVPEDIALVGFDDIAASRFVSPALSTVHVPAFGLGWSAAEVLIRIIEHDPSREVPVLLETELVIRESCGARPAS